MTQHVIEMREITKKFGDFVANDHINLNVRKGEIHALLGENGAGKSSILETLDSFFNYKTYPINKSALSDGIHTTGNEPFVAPIFLIEKSK